MRPALKTAFLVSLTLVSKASELMAFRSDLPFCAIHNDKVVLRLDITLFVKGGIRHAQEKTALSSDAVICHLPWPCRWQSTSFPPWTYDESSTCA